MLRKVRDEYKRDFFPVKGNLDCVEGVIIKVKSFIFVTKMLTFRTNAFTPTQGR
jgi:hypothetical protein